MQDIFSTFPIEMLMVALNILVLVILLVLTLVNASKIKKMKTKYTKFMGDLSDRNIEELMDTCLEELKDLRLKNREMENHINYIERNLLQCVQKMGIVRFNAFENVGSDLSYAVALLDSSDNGVVISSIYSRDNSTTYAKPVMSGKSKYSLSAEEIQALEIAKKNFSERLYTKDKQG